MPWYDYQCEKCGAVFEVQRAMSDDSKVKCHACGSARTVQIYSPAPVVFKGSGFYVTDSSTSKHSVLSPAASTPPPAPAPAPTPAPAADPAPKPKENAAATKQSA
jgi:putative FmdB family regulatory protein